MWTGANDTHVLWPARKVTKKLKHDGQVTEAERQAQATQQ